MSKLGDELEEILDDKEISAFSGLERVIRLVLELEPVKDKPATKADLIEVLHCVVAVAQDTAQVGEAEMKRHERKHYGK